ncbi:type VI secretion system-associated protein TagF [Rhodopila globiformis]|nr:type VI secretion system-associated protein TagF [Rhodopila globiformis]
MTLPLATGIFGKLPVRGDFVRLGLPRDCTDGWDHWLSEMTAETQRRAGAAWLDALQDVVSPEDARRMMDVPDLHLAVVSASRWWTDGSALVEPTGITLDGLPGAPVFAAMLGCRQPGATPPDETPGRAGPPERLLLSDRPENM